MNEIYIALLAFLFGLLSHILYGVINDSRISKSLKKAIKQEIQANFFQIRDGKKYSEEKTEELRKFGRGQPVVVMNYRFCYKSFEENISNLPKLGDSLSLKTHHFYSRLKVIENTTDMLLKLVIESKEIDKKEIPKSVKVLDESSLNSNFYQALEECKTFEEQSISIATELIELL